MSSNERALIEALLDGDREGWKSPIAALGNDRVSIVAMMALTNACLKQFTEDPSVDSIAAYVKQLQDRQPPDAGIKTVPTELVIRAVLGQPDVLRGISAEDLVRTQIVIVNTVAQDHHLVGEPRELFITEVLDALD